jgi:hypothetical protein
MTETNGYTGESDTRDSNALITDARRLLGFLQDGDFIPGLLNMDTSEQRKFLDRGIAEIRENLAKAKATPRALDPQGLQSDDAMEAVLVETRRLSEQKLREAHIAKAAERSQKRLDELHRGTAETVKAIREDHKAAGATPEQTEAAVQSFLERATDGLPEGTEQKFATKIETARLEQGGRDVA